jgi:hypothetical protein
MAKPVTFKTKAKGDTSFNFGANRKPRKRGKGGRKRGRKGAFGS